MGFLNKQQAAPTTKVILHVDDSELVCDVINGKPYKLEPNEPHELPIIVANAIIKHIGHLHGIVEVNQTRTKTGIEWDVEEAEKRAELYLVSCEKSAVDFYVRQQMEDRVAAGKPPLPPTGRAALIIVKRGISLKKEYGLTPLGWRDAGGDSEPNTVAAGADSLATQQLTAVIAAQQDQIKALAAQVQQLMGILNPGDEQKTDNEQQ